MPNAFDRQITQEGPRNAIVKLTGVLETTDASITPAISLGDFSNNETRCNLVGLRIDMIEYSIGGGLEILLEWNGLNPQQIFPIAGRGRIYGWNYGGFVPDMTRAGYTGGINLKTTGFVSGQQQVFTVVLELVKLYTV